MEFECCISGLMAFVHFESEQKSDGHFGTLVLFWNEGGGVGTRKLPKKI